MDYTDYLTEDEKEILRLGDAIHTRIILYDMQLAAKDPQAKKLITEVQMGCQLIIKKGEERLIAEQKEEERKVICLHCEKESSAESTRKITKGKYAHFIYRCKYCGKEWVDDIPASRKDQLAWSKENIQHIRKMLKEPGNEGIKGTLKDLLILHEEIQRSFELENESIIALEKSEKELAEAASRMRRQFEINLAHLDSLLQNRSGQA